MLKMPSGQRLSIIVGGRVVQVVVTCTEVAPRPAARFAGALAQAGIATVNVRDAVWNVRISCDGRTRSFRYTVGEGNRNYNTIIDFGAFATCIVEDARSGSMTCADFCREYGYGEVDGREVWEACRDCRTKLNHVLGAAYDDFARCTEYDSWII